MALRIFSQSPVSGKFDTGANWVGGTAPTNGDSWIIDGTADEPLEINIDDGLDQSANTFVNGVLGPNYRGQFGNSETAPFKGGFSGVLAVQGGAAKHYFDASAGKTIAEARMYGCGEDGGGDIYILGTVTKAVALIGTIWGWSGTWTEAHIASRAGSSNAQLRVRNADVATVYGFNGQVFIESDSTTGRIRSLINTSATSQILAGQLDAATIAGGSVTVETLTAISGAVMIHGGRFSLKNVQAQTVARVELFPAGTFQYNMGIDNDVITAYVNHGGKPESGAVA